MTVHIARVIRVISRASGFVILTLILHCARI